ncbi:hypothetical protein SESBI_47503 [Sesbania bispinosa]|nr:hypothetical protein SESBI_47503 [Sesbania bispinosa]
MEPIPFNMLANRTNKKNMFIDATIMQQNEAPLPLLNWTLDLDEAGLGPGVPSSREYAPNFKDNGTRGRAPPTFFCFTIS